MNEALQRKCQRCEKPLSPEVLDGLCPVCMLTVGETGTGDENAGSFEPLSPAELSRYFPALEIIELLGRGGMGAVYKARQKQLDRIVALKILPPDSGNDPSFGDRFTREARALAKLNHPHIVTLHEFGQTDGLFFFVMEFVDGVTLGQLLDGSRITPKEALAIVPQICDALQYAHLRGIVHRDIKPQNILLSKEGQVKIADFGVAKIVAGTSEEIAPGTGTQTASSKLTHAGRVVGTPAYMAPEQATQPFEVDHRADIYSLGVVFYQMLTGELPSGEMVPPSKKVVVDVRLDEVVLRALEKEPQRRYGQVSELRTQVETIAATLPAAESEIQATESGPPNVVTEAHQEKGNMKARHLIVSIVTIAFIAAIALFYVFRTKTPRLQEVTKQDIKEIKVEEWFDRMGEKETKLGYPPLTAMNALTEKGKQNNASREQIIRIASETIENPQQDTVKRWQSCYVLSNIGDKRGIPPITHALGDPNATVRSVAAAALGAFIDDAEARSALEAAAKSEDSPQVQDDIKEALSGKYRHPDFAKWPTQKDIHDISIEDWFARIGREREFKLKPFASMNALIQKAKQNDENRDKIFQKAVETIEDSEANEVTRWQCCYILSGIGDKRGIPTLTHALGDKSDTVRSVAACALGAFDDEDARTALKKAAKSESSPKVKEELKKALSGAYLTRRR